LKLNRSGASAETGAKDGVISSEAGASCKTVAPTDFILNQGELLVCAPDARKGSVDAST
jgi:hypothetical protein